MYNEIESNWGPSQTWGEFIKMRNADEQDERRIDWIEAGHIDDVSFDEENSRQVLHGHLNSFNKTLFEATSRPFRFIVEPVDPYQMAELVDKRLLFVAIEPYSDSVTLDQLKKFRDKVKDQQ